MSLPSTLPLPLPPHPLNTQYMPPQPKSPSQSHQQPQPFIHRHRDLLILTLLTLTFLYGLIHNSSPRRPVSQPTVTTIAYPIPPAAVPPTMSWFQKSLTLPAKSRGSYLITDEITRQLPEIGTYRVGLLHLFVQHTSCALSLNENWDADVRADMSDALDRLVPEDRRGEVYRHSCEGPDDMPAHVKSALVGASVTVPISNGKLATGTWQGIWYLEFRAARHSRKVVATIQGEKM